MLRLERRRDQAIIIRCNGEELRLTVEFTSARRVGLGFESSPAFQIVREEISGKQATPGDKDAPQTKNRQSRARTNSPSKSSSPQSDEDPAGT